MFVMLAIVAELAKHDGSVVVITPREKELIE